MPEQCFARQGLHTHFQTVSDKLAALCFIFLETYRRIWQRAYATARKDPHHLAKKNNLAAASIPFAARNSTSLRYNHIQKSTSFALAPLSTAHVGWRAAVGTTAAAAADNSSSMSGGVSRLDGRAPDGKDFANYFCTYAYLYHQVSTRLERLI